MHTIKNLEIIYKVKYSVKEISLRDSSNLITSRTFLAVLTFWKINIGLIKFANKIRQLDKQCFGCCLQVKIKEALLSAKSKEREMKKISSYIFWERFLKSLKELKIVATERAC